MEVKRLHLIGPNRLEWKSEPLPELMDNEILVKTSYSAINIGRELPLFLGNEGMEKILHYPQAMGYESFGQVVSTGKLVQSVHPRDYVLSCYGHATYGIVEEKNALIVPAEASPSLSLLSYLYCDIIRGIDVIHPDPDQPVLITGSGATGLLTLLLLKKKYDIKSVEVLEPAMERHALAVAYGADHVYTQRELKTNHYLNGFECSGSTHGFNLLQKALGRGGSICVVSNGTNGKLTLYPEFHQNELRIVSSNKAPDYSPLLHSALQDLQAYPELKALYQLTTNYRKITKSYHDISNYKINPLRILVDFSEEDN